MLAVTPSPESICIWVAGTHIIQPSAVPQQVASRGLCFGSVLGVRWRGAARDDSLVFLWDSKGRELLAFTRGRYWRTILLALKLLLRLTPKQPSIMSPSVLILPPGTGPGSVHRTFSRVQPQKGFLFFPRNSSWFSTDSYLDRFGIPSPSCSHSRHLGAYENVMEGQSLGAAPDPTGLPRPPSSRAGGNTWAWILGCS